MIWSIVGILAIALIFVVVLILRKKKQTKPTESIEALTDLRVTDAQVGDSISISGAGDDYEDLNFDVDRKHRYDSGGDESFELSGLYRGRRGFLEVSQDDQISVVLYAGNVKPELHDLGLSEEDLTRMDQNQDRAEVCQYDGSRWNFQESGEVHFFREAGSTGEGFYSWEFWEESGARVFSVQKWEGAPFEVSLGRVVNADDVHVFRH